MSPNIVNFTVNVGHDPKPRSLSAGVPSEPSPSARRGHVGPAAPGTDESPVLRRLAVPWSYPAFCPPASGAPPGTGPAPTDRAPRTGRSASTDPGPAPLPLPPPGATTTDAQRTGPRPLPWPPLVTGPPTPFTPACSVTVQQRPATAPSCPGLDERGTAAPQPGTRKGKGTPATPSC